MAVIIVNPSDTQGAARVADVGPLPDDPAANAAYVLEYTGENLTTVTVTRHGVTWTRTLGYTGAKLVTVGAWVRS